MNSAILYRLAAVVLLGAMAADNYSTNHHSPELDKYHQAVQRAGNAIPKRMGPWVGQDQEVSTQALTVLRPNVLISRSYVNVETGQVAGLLLVHCKDAHHMVGHFPMRCYPADGWKMESYSDKDWVADDLKLTGTEYHFTKTEETLQGAPREQSIIVINCLLRPDGMVLRDMDAMSKTILGAYGQAAGAGQIQVYFDGGVSKEVREKAVVSLTEGCLPTIHAILAKAPS